MNCRGGGQRDVVSFSTDTHPLHTVTRAHTLLIHGHAAGCLRSSAAQIALPDPCECGQGQRLTQIGLALLGISCSMRHLEVQIFVESHGSVYTELLLCAEHGRRSDPEDSSVVWVRTRSGHSPFWEWYSLSGHLSSLDLGFL